MDCNVKAKILVALVLCSPNVGFAVPAFFDVRYEFTTDDVFLASFGVQATVSGVARYSMDQADQLPDDTHSGHYDLISNRVTVNGVKATEATDPFGSFVNSFEIGNDLGYGLPPPWVDVFSIGSTFNQPFGAGLTLTGVRIDGTDDLGDAITSDSIFRLDPSDWQYLTGMIQFIPAGATSAVGIFAFKLDSIRVTPVPEPGSLGLLGFGLAGLGLSRRRKA